MQPIPLFQRLHDIHFRGQIFSGRSGEWGIEVGHENFDAATPVGQRRRGVCLRRWLRAYDCAPTVRAGGAKPNDPNLVDPNLVDTNRSVQT